MDEPAFFEMVTKKAETFEAIEGTGSKARFTDTPFPVNRETDARYSVADLGYQDSIFLTDSGRRAVWDYETDYSVEDAE